MNIFKGKTILVTGGCGSIGSEITRQLLKYGPKQIRVFDNRETASFHSQEELKDNRVSFLIGSIRDKDRVIRAAEGVDIIFHTAALKHIGLCEYNPLEAVKTNVLGTQNIIEAALKNNIKKVINISTDKITNTINTLGATKLLGERLISTAQYFKGNKKTLFSSVRFGNVANSNGSVIKLWQKQIKNNQSITITNQNMTRFIMSISQAVKLVLRTAESMKGGEIFILKMPVFKIEDLADIIIEKANKKIEKKIIGIRPGEKLYEDLMTEEEAKWALETKEIFIITPPILIPNFNTQQKQYKGAKQTQIKEYSSKEITPLTIKELKNLLIREKII